jgi:hypothetical protein
MGVPPLGGDADVLGIDCRFVYRVVVDPLSYHPSAFPQQGQQWPCFFYLIQDETADR